MQTVCYIKEFLNAYRPAEATVVAMSFSLTELPVRFVSPHEQCEKNVYQASSDAKLPHYERAHQAELLILQ